MPSDNRTQSQPGVARDDVAPTRAAALRAWQHTRRRIHEPAPVVAEDVEHEVRELLYGWRSGHLQVSHSDRRAPDEIPHKPAARSSARARMRH